MWAPRCPYAPLTTSRRAADVWVECVLEEFTDAVDKGIIMLGPCVTFMDISDSLVRYQ